jgi:hypothetical protein
MPMDKFLEQLNSSLRTPIALSDPPKLPLPIPEPLTSLLSGVHNAVQSMVVTSTLNAGRSASPP